MKDKYRIKKDTVKIPAYQRDDARLIRYILAINECHIDLAQACQLWKKISEDMCAGWLVLPREKDLFQYILPYLEKIDE